MSATVRTALELARKLQAHGYTADEATQAVAQRAGRLHTATLEEVERDILTSAPPARRVSPETQARIDRANARVVQGPGWRAELAREVI